ncbi:hypothetical protein [Peterkaempfera bronchialis]|uniref:Uncharacterized protein n=1 Tax=Peterkaempfera bronchialis TaxID=2126346 RepID=A0A345ST20_9ACTN|nr:hypothetical protein [Peterkaempfera bronchialis]AXI76875.1 hypothetical protein C7M71_004805 [Peterkaempfera bronchialis]
MQLTLLGTTSTDGNCPTLYATDRGTLVVQGYRVTDPGTVAQLRDLLPGETAVEIPRELLAFAPGSDRDG